jgi:hypothetical protein
MRLSGTIPKGNSNASSGAVLYCCSTRIVSNLPQMTASGCLDSGTHFSANSHPHFPSSLCRSCPHRSASGSHQIEQTILHADSTCQHNGMIRKGIDRKAGWVSRSVHAHYRNCHTRRTSTHDRTAASPPLTAMPREASCARKPVRTPATTDSNVTKPII